MLLAISMVAMVVISMAVAVYAVISAALYKDIDNQLQSRAQLLIASGSLAADPAKAIEGTAYSDVNAMLVNPGRSIFTANQEGQSLPVGQAEKAVIRGPLAPWPAMPWEAGHKAPQVLARRLAEFEYDPSLAKVAGVGLAAMQG